jgi:protein MPE1
MKAGAGRAARYVTGNMPIKTKNSSRKEQASSKSSAKPASAIGLAQMSNMTEEQKMAAMFAAQSEQWSAQQEEMAL